MPAAWGINADGTIGPDAGTGPDAAVLPAVARLAEIPGLSPMLARTIIAEIGLDMSRFPTAGHLVSWAGLCPSARQSGARTRAGKKGQGDTWLRGALGQAATGAARMTTFLGERYHRIARRRGKAKAQVAVARSILVIIWHLLSDPAARLLTVSEVGCSAALSAATCPIPKLTVEVRFSGLFTEDLAAAGRVAGQDRRRFPRKVSPPRLPHYDLRGT